MIPRTGYHAAHPAVRFRPALNTFVKMLLTTALLLLYTMAASALALLPVGPTVRRRLLTRNVSRFARIALKLLGIRVIERKRGSAPVAARSHLIAANHLSYIDILAIAAQRPAVFITSVELKSTVPLGLLAWLGGSIFVERRSASGLKKEIRDIAGALRDGSSVVLFPEGTTFNGDTVQPFKNSLFAAAISAGSPVLPVCIRYRRANGRRLNGLTCDSVYYYGGTTFAAHVPRLLSLRSLHVALTTLDPIPVVADLSRKDLAARCHRIIHEEYHRVQAG